jgi:hypothetical protein
MPSLDTWLTVDHGPREPDLPDPEAVAAQIRQYLAERRRYQFPPARSLAGLRRSLGVSQETLAARLGLKQARLSRFEHHPDPRLGALTAFVTALGGSLVLLARFPDRDICLTPLDRR